MKRKKVLEFDDQNSPDVWPSVSLCMIVKNEEDNLADCLKSVGDFAAETIIVDTGSTDRTVKIARSCGARVEHFAWIDDFAAARNESLKYAIGQWIFWMDADDRIAPNQLIRLKNALVSEQADAYFCSIISGVGIEAGTQSVTTHLRLFPNHQGVYFVNPIHEDAGTVAQRLGLIMAHTNITINHVGYTANAHAMHARGARNERIVRRVIAEEPENPRWRYDLAAALNLQGDYNGVVEQLEPLLTVTPSPPELDRNTALYHAYLLLISAYGKLHQPDEVFRVLGRAFEIFPNRRHLRVSAGILYWQQNQLEQAVTAFEHAQTLSLASDPAGFTHAPGELEKLLSRPCFLLGNRQQAKETYLVMLTHKGMPPGPVASPQWQQAGDFFDAGQYNRVIKLLDPLSAGDSAALRLLFLAAVKLQLWGRALFYLLDAVILSRPEPGEWVKLTQVAVQAGKGSLTERIGNLALLEEEDIEQRMVLFNLLGMSAFQQENPAQAMACFIQAMIINPKNKAARNNLTKIAQVGGLSPAEAIRQQARQWLGLEKYDLAADALALVIATAPKDVDARKLLAVTLQKLGREDDALKVWQTI